MISEISLPKKWFVKTATAKTIKTDDIMTGLRFSLSLNLQFSFSFIFPPYNFHKYYGNRQKITLVKPQYHFNKKNVFSQKTCGEKELWKKLSGTFIRILMHQAG